MRRPSRASVYDWFQAVSHPTRVDILRHFMATGTATPSKIAKDFEAPVGTIGYHVRLLAGRDILRLAGRTPARGGPIQHYQLADRERTASALWGMRAELLVTGLERENGRGDVTVQVDAEALSELTSATDTYLRRLGELGLQTRERRSSGTSQDATVLTQVAVLMAIDADEGDDRPDESQ